jgi:hypothetical protein
MISIYDMNNMLGGEAKQNPLDSRYTAVLIKTPKLIIFVPFFFFNYYYYCFFLSVTHESVCSGSQKP